MFLIQSALAIEGMWEPKDLGRVPGLAALGFAGSPDALSRLDAAPLAAVVSLGGCTASFVSTEGLLVTNHHCVVGHLQQAQQDGEDLVATGFYAPTRADERLAPDHRVSITERLEDVTGWVLARLPKDDGARYLAVEDRKKKLVSNCEKRAPGRRCRVATYDGGLRYQLITQLELRDVRAVMAPPDSVGNYGDEIDNWHWPRHSGDFGFLRAYVGPDGAPADPSPANVPYRPAHVLNLDPTGAAPGEFVMVAGYPGRTERFWTASRLGSEISRDMPADIRRLQAWLDLFAAVVKDDPTQEPVVNVPRSYVSNGLFNRKGALEGFVAAGSAEQAAERDRALAAWIDAEPARSLRWKAPWAELEALQRADDATWQREEAMKSLGNSDLLSAAEALLRFAVEKEKPDAKRRAGYQDRDRPRGRARMSSMQKSLSMEVERRFLRAMLLELAQLPPAQQVPELMAWLGTGSAEERVEAAITRLFSDPALDTAEERTRWFDAERSAIESSKDGFLSLAVALRPYRDARYEETQKREGARARVEPLYIEAVRSFDAARAYSDANGTLRVSLGTVRGYDPRDAIRYQPQTRVEGVLEKAGPWPFDAPPALLEAIRSGKRGPYADAALGSVPVNFLTDLDTTGGNSGSPTLNASGELVGLVFDGNYEGIASDWVYDGARNRSIHVDIRYVLYYLDAVSDADALLRELRVNPSW